ncbi:MAG: MFS transporter [Erysipelotrichaceae bacterium]|nr:MFS transporter [Erysipelotrichaceae bacterium]MCI9313039.1 MFS transporter [Erysipelotrichaceae bacterium]
MMRRWNYYCLNFLSFFAISLVNTQMIPYLSTLGYDVVQRGYLLAANACIAIIGQFLFGYLCDRFRHIKPFFTLAYVLFLLSGLMLFWMSNQLFWYHLVSAALSGGMVKVIMGLNETWMLEADGEHYGVLRCFGALGLTLGSPFAGWLSDAFGYGALMISLAVVSGLNFLFIYLVRDVQKQAGTIHLSSLQQLVKNRPYLLLVLIYLLVYMIGTADQYVVVDKMLELGASRAVVGFKWALQSFMEVPLFLFAGKLLKRFQPKVLLVFGTVMYGIKFALYAFLQNEWAIVAAASLQLVTLPIILLTSKVLIQAVTPKQLCSSAQMFAMGIFIGVSGLITPLITSNLAAALGYDATLYLVAAFISAPLFVIWLYLRVMRQAEQTEK